MSAIDVFKNLVQRARERLVKTGGDVETFDAILRGDSVDVPIDTTYRIDGYPVVSRAEVDKRLKKKDLF